jgi:SPP1 family predicted phage head-tail adaptor
MIGRLDRRITIIKPILSQGTSGEDKITGWEELDNLSKVWAMKSETRGNTLVQSDRVVFSQTVTWTVRYRTDLTVAMRIVNDDSQVYEIIGINEANKGRERFTEITANFLDNVYWT